MSVHPNARASRREFLGKSLAQAQARQASAPSDDLPFAREEQAARSSSSLLMMLIAGGRARQRNLVAPEATAAMDTKTCSSHWSLASLSPPFRLSSSSQRRRHTAIQMLRMPGSWPSDGAKANGRHYRIATA